MIEVVVAGEPKQAVFGVWALALYEQEFSGRNLIGDIFGDVDISKNSSDGGLHLDFNSNDWLAYSRALWAGLKCADDSTPGFEQWAKSVSQMDMWDVSRAVADEVVRTCFRSGADASE